MAAPYEIRDTTKSNLWTAFQAMMSPEWDIALMGKPTSVVRDAAICLLETQRARVRLGTLDLADIRDKLVENEQGLKEGGEAMKEALEELEEVEQVISTLAAFLSVVKEVVDIAT